MKTSLRVLVLMGGPSEEHEVSLKSGRGAAQALAQRGIAAEPVLIPRTVSIDEACAVVSDAIQRLEPDVVFIALHGTFGEDGAIQQVCESLHVAYTGSDTSASRLGMDKIASRQRFIDAGLEVPRWRALPPTRLVGGRVVDPARIDHAVLKGLRYPLVVKPSAQGSSIGVSLVARPSEFSAAVREAARHGSQVLAEEFVRVARPLNGG